MSIIPFSHITLIRHFGPAMVGEFVNRTTNFLTGRYLDRQVSIDDKLKKLKLLLFKINSAIEAAESAMPIGNLSLCRWLGELQEAAREGDDVLIIFKARSAEGPLHGANSNHFLLAPLWNTFKLIVGATHDLFWHDYEVDRLSGSLDRMEKISSGLASFLALLEIDGRRRNKHHNGHRNGHGQPSSGFSSMLLDMAGETNMQGIDTDDAEQSHGSLYIRNTGANSTS